MAATQRNGLAGREDPPAALLRTRCPSCGGGRVLVQEEKPKGTVRSTCLLCGRGDEGRLRLPPPPHPATGQVLDDPGPRPTLPTACGGDCRSELLARPGAPYRWTVLHDPHHHELVGGEREARRAAEVRRMGEWEARCRVSEAEARALAAESERRRLAAELERRAPAWRPRADISARLTAREEQILRRLGQGRGELVSHDVLAVAVFGVGGESVLHGLRVHMGRLRRKLPAGAIENQQGRGYRLADPSVGAEVAAP